MTLLVEFYDLNVTAPLQLVLICCGCTSNALVIIKKAKFFRCKFYHYCLKSVFRSVSI